MPILFSFLEMKMVNDIKLFRIYDSDIRRWGRKWSGDGGGLFFGGQFSPPLAHRKNSPILLRE
jgi:hypothetical protein